MGDTGKETNMSETRAVPSDPKSQPAKPAYVSALETAYGAPSQEGFGSAIFFERMAASDDLEEQALEKYKYFVGSLWERYGEAAWMGPWRLVYSRAADARREIAAELSAISEPDAASSVFMVLDVDKAALVAAFDDPAVTTLAVYNAGDGQAMSGVVIAGQRAATGETTFLVFLMD